jgi:hypothetical protein
MKNKNKIKRIKADWAEVAELACEITGTDEEAIYGDFDILEDRLYEELNIDFDSFHEIINRLLPLVDVGKSPLSGKHFKGFSKVEDGMGCWIVKAEI